MESCNWKEREQRGRGGGGGGGTEVGEKGRRKSRSETVKKDGGEEEGGWGVGK